MASRFRSFTYWGIVLGLLLSGLSARPASAAGPPRFKAVAFDYFVIFDPNSIVPEIDAAFPGRGKEFVNLWRTRQFEYAWLRSMTNRYVDFFRVTEDALVYTANALQLDLTPERKTSLLNAYMHLKPWPDAEVSLRKLKDAGVRVITIANFSPAMLRSNAEGAHLTGLFDELLSTDANHTYKPDPRAYELGVKRLNLKKEDIVFAAFGGWDAAGAKAFGYPTFWVNRFALPPEELGVAPDGTSNTFAGLLAFVLGDGAGR
jgi:2-haloacid dehalogenase